MIYVSCICFKQCENFLLDWMLRACLALCAERIFIPMRWGKIWNYLWQFRIKFISLHSSAYGRDFGKYLTTPFGSIKEKLCSVQWHGKKINFKQKNSSRASRTLPCHNKNIFFIISSHIFLLEEKTRPGKSTSFPLWPRKMKNKRKVKVVRAFQPFSYRNDDSNIDFNELSSLEGGFTVSIFTLSLSPSQFLCSPFYI